jgi:hypothetical protein
MNLLALQTGLRDWLTAEEAPALKAPNREAGLSVYLNNYRAQLMACLRESYPTLHAWLGDDAFDAAAAAQHIDRSPPAVGRSTPMGWAFPTLCATFIRAMRSRRSGRAGMRAGAGLYRAGQPAARSGQPCRDRLGPCQTALYPGSRAASRQQQCRGHLVRHRSGRNAACRSALPQPGAILVWREGFTPPSARWKPPRPALWKPCKRAAISALCAMLVAREGEVAGPRSPEPFWRNGFSDGIIAQISDQTLVTESSLDTSFFQHEEGDDRRPYP